MTCNDLKRPIVTFWPNKMAKPNTDLESWLRIPETILNKHIHLDFWIFYFWI